MLKARNKKVSMLLVLAMLMTMFVGVGTASAATTYSAVTIPTFGTSTTYGDLGIIEVDLSTAIGVKNGDILTVSLPSSVTAGGIAITGNVTVATAVYDAASLPAPGATTSVVGVVAPEFLPGTNDVNNAIKAAKVAVSTGSTGKSVDIRFTADGSAGQGVMYIYLKNAKVEASEDIVAGMVGSNNATFPSQYVTIGKVITGSGTTTSVKSIKSIGSDGGLADTVTMLETKTGSLQAGDTLKFKLPSGFGWEKTAYSAISPNWAYTGYTTSTDGTAAKIMASINAERTLTLTLGSTFAPSTSTTGLGRIDFGGYNVVITDDSVAKEGDVTMSVSGTNVTDQDLVVANYGEFGATVSENAVDTATAGWDSDLSDASIKISETLAGSLINGRNISLTLPTGCKWITNTNGLGTGSWPDNGSGAPLAVEYQKGSATIVTSSLATISTSNNHKTLKLTVNNVTSGATKSVILLKKFQVAISPDFSGDLNLEVAGTENITGTVKIADVSPSLKLAASNSKANIVIGGQGQTVGDITLTESAKETIDPSATTAPNDNVVLRLPAGAAFTSKPDVKVTAGDVDIDKTDLANDDRDLVITFKSSSTTASTITVSGIKVTTDRSLPEGDFKVKLVGADGNYNNAGGSGAITDNAGTDRFDVGSIASVVVGQCVTPSGATTTTGEFKIGSNIYTVNGVSKVMDVAPYIKNGRTYVPMRYAAEIIGAEVVWDATAQTVTLTKGDTVVVFTIGSTTYTVNGEAKTCDVAPELSSDRTMLPARYVAEAFGSSVGWDAATQTVVIQ